MSLPLRLPYSYPERRWRGALWLADFCAPVTPRPRLPRLLVGDRPEARGRQRGGLLGGGGLGSGRKLREERLRRWHGRHPPRPGVPGLAVRSPGGTAARLQPFPAGRARSQHHAVNPARLSSRPPPHRPPGESRTASLALLEQPRLAERSLNSVQISRLSVVGGASRRRCRLSGFSKRSRTEGSLG